MVIDDSLRLPTLVGIYEKYSNGVVCKVLRKQMDVRVLQRSEYRYSARTSFDLLELDNGEKIIVIDRLAKISPDDVNVDGILYINGTKKGKWVWHRKLINYEPESRNDVSNQWVHKFQFRREHLDGDSLVVAGLRPPQLGALHAIGAHWSISNQAGTIVMPTGTGKTETMVAAMLNYLEGCLLVVVPSQALRQQLSNKFISLGLLRTLGCIPDELPNPIVGIMNRRPITETDLGMFERCNVVITTINTIAQGSAVSLIDKIVEKCTCLIMDEAHHIAADSWTLIRDAFKNKKVLQFTATPFRRDGKPVDGKVIYSYPLSKAQSDGYFKPIHFRPVFELRAEQSDEVIANAAIQLLKEDLEQGYDHILMARCSTITRAEEVFKYYRNNGQEFNPIIVHSEADDKAKLLVRILDRQSRIVVCVDMLGEGFDLPQLKIAALHDTHKSLAVLLQFVGRFTRTSGSNLGDASVIANIANQHVLEALERLYSEDADWNTLLSEYASEAVKDHAAMIKFLENSEKIFSTNSSVEQDLMSPKMLFPKFSTAIFTSDQFNPRKFHEGLQQNFVVRGAWINDVEHTVFFVTESQQKVKWSRLKSTLDHKWDLYILYYNPVTKLLFVHSSDKDSLHQELATSVSSNTAFLLMGDVIFKSLGNISRLVFQNIGLKKPGRRNLRYSMYTGADVSQALSPAQKATSTKSNVFGGGYENGKPVNIGCSYKGRIWSKDQGPIYRFIEWCDYVGEKVINPDINTDEIIDNVLIPVLIEQMPDKKVLAIDWPVELLQKSEESIVLSTSNTEVSFSNYSIEYVGVDEGNKHIIFSVIYNERITRYGLILGENGFTVQRLSGDDLVIKVGRIVSLLNEWFQEYPPNILFVDGSELDGNLLIEPKQNQGVVFPLGNIEVWDWTGTDITKESQWKDKSIRTESVQYKVLQEFINGYDVVIDDDDTGEAADVICITETPEKIKVVLIHCKFSGGNLPGQRVKDVMEVCGQASRSVKWSWKFSELCKHILNRESVRGRRGRITRFTKGRLKDVLHYSKASRFKPVEFEVFAVQPGLSKSNMTEEQINILNSAYGYILEITGVQFKMICSE